MKIVYLASDYGLHLDMTGGAGTHMRGTIKAMRALGHEVLPIIGGDVLQHFPPKPQASARVGAGTQRGSALAPWLPRPIRLLVRDLRYYLRGREVIWKTFDRIKTFCPDAIYERSAYMNDAGCILARRLNIPVFFETDGHIVAAQQEQYGVFSRALAEFIELQKIKRASRVVVMAVASIDVIVRKYRCRPSKVLIKPLGVDPVAFQVDEAARAALVQEHTLQGRFVVGFIAGELHHYHGLDLLLKTAEATQQNPQIVYLVIAGGKLAERYRLEFSHLKNLIFLDLVPKTFVANYISLFDVGVVPDCVEHIFPIKVLEYGLLGACPLVPDYPAFESLFRFPDRRTVLVEPRNLEALKIAILSLASNSENTKRLARAWSSEVLKNYTWERALTSVLDGMVSALSDAQRSGSVGRKASGISI